MVDNSCTLKDCRLRTADIEIPENRRNYSEDYPFNTYGIGCDVDCKIRDKWRGINYGDK